MGKTDHPATWSRQQSMRFIIGLLMDRFEDIEDVETRWANAYYAAACIGHSFGVTKQAFGQAAADGLPGDTKKMTRQIAEIYWEQVAVELAQIAGAA
jgi:hypothetical protein